MNSSLNKDKESELEEESSNDSDHSKTQQEKEHLNTKPKKLKKQTVFQNQEKLKFFTTILGCILILFAIILCVYPNLLEKTVEENGENEKGDRFEEIFNNLQSNFPSQNTHSFRVMKAAVRSIIKTQEPKGPSVITLLSFQEADVISKCLAHTLALDIKNLLEDPSYISLDAFQYKYDNPSSIKHKIEDAVVFGVKNGSHVIVVEHFDYIPAESILIFHGLCDDTTAPYKRIVFIFTVQLNDDLKRKNLKDIEVTHSWSDNLHVEQRAALESRIGSFKILVSKETSNVVQKKCSIK